MNGIELTTILEHIHIVFRLFELFKKYDGLKKNEIKMKRPTQLMEVLELARSILHEKLALKNEILNKVEESEELAEGIGTDLEQQLEIIDYSIKKWEQIRTVLEM